MRSNDFIEYVRSSNSNKMALNAGQLVNLIRRAPSLGFRVCNPPENVGAPECVIAFADQATPRLIRTLESNGMKVRATHDGFIVLSGERHTYECKVCLARATLPHLADVGTRVRLRWRHHGGD